MPTEQTIPANANASVVSFSVKINGDVIPNSFKVKQLTVAKEVNRIPMAKVVLIDGDVALVDFPASNHDLFIPGNEIELFAGHQSEEDLIFKGIIIKHGISVRQNGTSLLNLDCKNPAIKLTVGRKSRYFSDKKDSEAIAEILDDINIEHEFKDTGVTHNGLVQYYCTDWDFIVTRAELNGKLCLLDDGVFTIAPPDFEQDSVLTLKFGATALAFDAEIDARYQYTGVKSKAWDFANQELLEAEAQSPELTTTGNLEAKDLSTVIGLGTLEIQHSGQMPEDELQAWADAQLLKSRLAMVRGSVKFEGFAGVKPGNLVTLEGFGNRFNGDVYVSGVHHELIEGAWHTYVQFGLTPEWFSEKFQINAPESSGLTPAIRGLQIGKITQLQDDPDGEYRVLVNTPVINPEEEGTWCRVAAPDAGENHGFFFRPEIGDEVILGFINNDPRDAVVLGSLYSSARRSPIEQTDDNFEKGYISKSEMKFVLNDDIKSWTFETPGGNKLLLSEDEEGIILEDQNGNKIILNGDGISMESASDINIKTSSGDLNIEGNNITQKANTQFKADGQSGIEVSSSATATLKGALVQIN